MKQKISITLDKETLFQIEEKITEGLFRNRSHVLEFAVKRMLRDGNERQ